MVICTKKGKVVKSFPYGSEEQQRYEAVLEILFEADNKRFEQLLNEKREKEQRIDVQIEEKHKKRFQKIRRISNKKYNLTQTARILRVHRQTIYYWFKKGWVTPKRDYRNFPVFTKDDLKKIRQWKNKIIEG
ncbi:MAG: MerR family transcriptional regulator [Candidatus Omnitrophota bacterium]